MSKNTKHTGAGNAPDMPPDDPPSKEDFCRNCHKPLSENSCGIDGKQRSYCVPEGENDSPAQKARIEEAAARQSANG